MKASLEKKPFFALFPPQIADLLHESNESSKQGKNRRPNGRTLLAVMEIKTRQFQIILEYCHFSNYRITHLACGVRPRLYPQLAKNAVLKNR